MAKAPETKGIAPVVVGKVDDAASATVAPSASAQPAAVDASAASAPADAVESVSDRFIYTSGPQPTLAELNARSHQDTFERVKVYDDAHDAAQKAISAVFGKHKAV